MASLTPARARALKPRLDAFLAGFPHAQRIPFDPIEFPHRYARREDVEIAGLLSACLAYGRADLFRPKLARLLEAMGGSPADFAAGFDPRRHRRAFEGFVYRFNLAADIATLVAGAGALLRAEGSLGAAFEGALPLREGLSRFAARIREVDRRAIVRELGPVRGLAHLLPEPARGGSCKRLLLFLRWMVRGPDAVDFGLWMLPASKLVIPLDAHVGRIARHLGLTRRKDLSWRTAEDVTASLRLLDAGDPVKYDFALCHYGMSGACPIHVRRDHCDRCALRTVCRTGKRLVPASIDRPSHRF